MKNSKKAIIISFDGKWSHREQKRFKVEHLQSKGVQVKVLADNLEEDFDDLRLSKKELIRFIKESRKKSINIFLFHTNPNFPNLFMLFILTILKVRYGILLNNQILETFNFMHINNFLGKLYSQLLFIIFRRPDFLFYGGESSKETFLYKYAINKVPIHSHDYESFIEQSAILSPDNAKDLNKEYIVFIDEGGDYHPDQYIVKGYSGFKKGYYEDLKRFLKRVSKITHKDVYIALHPSVDESKLDFGDFKVFKNITKELIKYSDFVLMHKSTSISFVTLYDKNVIILESKFSQDLYRKHLYNLAYFFDTKPLKMYESDLDNQDFKKYFCNRKKYKDYLEQYVNANVNNRRSWIDICLENVF